MEQSYFIFTIYGKCFMLPGMALFALARQLRNIPHS